MATVETPLLLAAAVALRACAAVLGAAPASLAAHVAGWALAGTAAWSLAGAAGAWTPLWPALAATLVLAPINRRMVHPGLRPAGDALLVAGLGSLSIPVLSPVPLGAAALLMAGAGAGLDLAATRLREGWQRAARFSAWPVVVAVAAFFAYALLPPGDERRPLDLHETLTLSSGVTRARVPGEQRVTLATGAIAWLDLPRGDGPFPGALFFHGADARGSHQPAALAARRALLAAGFAVLAVDHPGYGQSPHPARDAPVTAWDPLPTDRAAYDVLRAVPGVREIILVGHSMGNTDLLRLLRADVPLAGAVGLGAGLHTLEREDYWDERFLSDRGITQPMDLKGVREIRQAYYENRRYLDQLSPPHAPVRSVNFGVEWPDLVETREEYHARLPGPKSVWQLPDSTHYMSAQIVLGLLVGDTCATRSLMAGFQVLARQLADAAGPVAPQDRILRSRLCW